MTSHELYELQRDVFRAARYTETPEVAAINEVLTAAIFIEGRNAKPVPLPKTHTCAGTVAGAATCAPCLKRKPPQIAPADAGAKLDPLHACAGSPDPAVTATCPQCRARKIDRSLPKYERVAAMHGGRFLSKLKPYSDGSGEMFRSAYSVKMPCAKDRSVVTLGMETTPKTSPAILKQIAASALAAIRAAGYTEAQSPAKNVRMFERAADSTMIVARVSGGAYEVVQSDNTGNELSFATLTALAQIDALTASIALPVVYAAPAKKGSKKAKAAVAAPVIAPEPVAPAPIAAPAPPIVIEMPVEAVEAVVAQVAAAKTNTKKAAKAKAVTAVAASPAWDKPGTLDTSEIGMRKRFTGMGSQKSQPLSYYLAQAMQKYSDLSDEDARFLALADLEAEFASGALTLNMSVHAIASRAVWADPAKRAKISAAIKAGHAARKAANG